MALYTVKTRTLRKSMYIRTSFRFVWSYSKTAISFNILLLLQILWRYKTKQKAWGAILPPPPPPPPTPATLVIPW